MKVYCPHCSQKYTITKAQLGIEIDCQACKKIMVFDENSTQKPEPNQPDKPQPKTSKPEEESFKRVKCPHCEDRIKITKSQIGVEFNPLRLNPLRLNPLRLNLLRLNLLRKRLISLLKSRLQTLRKNLKQKNLKQKNLKLKNLKLKNLLKRLREYHSESKSLKRKIKNLQRSQLQSHF